MFLMWFIIWLVSWGIGIEAENVYSFKPMEGQYSSQVKVCRSDELYEQGYRLLQDGSLSAGISCINQILSGTHDHVNSLLIRSEYSYYAGAYDEAKVDLERAIRVAPSQCRGYFLGGLIAKAEKNYDEAIRYFKLCLDFEEISQSAKYELGCLLILNDEFDLAKQYFVNICALFEDESSPREFNDGLKLNSESFFSSLVEAGLRNSLIFEARADIRASLGRRDESIRDYKEAISLDSSAHLYHKLAVSLYESGEYGQALCNIEAALSLNPLDFELYRFLSFMKLHEEGGGEALASIEKGLRVIPEDLNLLFLKAELLQKAERYLESSACYSVIIAHYASCHGILFRRGYAFSKSGQYEDAISDYSLLLKLGVKAEDELFIHKKLSALYWHSDDLQSAKIHVLAGLSLDPQNEKLKALYDSIRKKEGTAVNDGKRKQEAPR